MHLKSTERATYYAGNNSTLKAVATTAHCAIDGYKSAIETFPLRRVSFKIVVALNFRDLTTEFLQRRSHARQQGLE